MIRLVLGFVAAAAVTGGAVAQPAVERGSYLVNTIMTCGNCHSPKGPPAAVAGKDYSGGLRFDEPPFDVTAPNITPDKETGIGNWTDAQIKTLLLTGKHPHGVPLGRDHAVGVLPDPHARRSRRHRRLSASLPPVKNKVPDPIYKIALPHHVFPGAEKAYARGRPNDKVKQRLLSRHHRPLHGMPHAVGAAGGPRFRQFARQGRPRIPRALGRVDVAQHHLAQDRRHRRLDRRRDQDARSPRASARTARRSRRRWATSTTPR